MRKVKLTMEQKIEIVRLYFEGKEGKCSLARRYGIDESTVRDYIAKYEAQGIEGFIDHGKNRVYSEELKNQAIHAYMERKGSTREIAAQFGLRSSHQLQKWIKVYNSGRGFRRKMSGGSRMKEARPTTADCQRLHSKWRELRRNSPQVQCQLPASLPMGKEVQGEG